MKRNPLGVNLAKSDMSNRINIGGNPTFTDTYLDRIEKENKEGKNPPEGDVLINHYTDRYHRINSKYTINRNGEIKSLKGKVMKYLFYPNKRGPRVRIQIEKKDKNGNFVFLEKEVSVLKLMEKYFGMYITGYKQKNENQGSYILVPKDGDYNNVGYNNLHYVDKKEYYKTKEKIIEYTLQINPNISNIKLSKMLGTTQQYVQKVKNKLSKMGKLSSFQRYQEAQKEIGIEFNEESLKIYQALIEYGGQLQNMEIAKLIRPNEIENCKDKSYYTDKIVRVRKRLVDKGIITRINGKFESQREEAVRMIKDKANSGKTNKEIAEILGLKKSQIDNLSKQIKKK